MNKKRLVRVDEHPAKQDFTHKQRKKQPKWRQEERSTAGEGTWRSARKKREMAFFLSLLTRVFPVISPFTPLPDIFLSSSPKLDRTLQADGGGRKSVTG